MCMYIGGGLILRVQKRKQQERLSNPCFASTKHETIRVHGDHQTSSWETTHWSTNTQNWPPSTPIALYTCAVSSLAEAIFSLPPFVPPIISISLSLSFYLFLYILISPAGTACACPCYPSR